MTHLTGALWRKSSRSGNQGNCVEAATNLRDVVGLRDSKDPHGPALAVAPSSWTAFLGHLKTAP